MILKVIHGIGPIFVELAIVIGLGYGRFWLLDHIRRRRDVARKALKT